MRLNVTQQPLAALGAWAARHTTAEDVLILEASANSFAIAERLTALGRQVYILESHRAGQIGKSYLANDKVDAVKIARIYLSGLGIKVWAPDPETRQRRELLSTYQRCVKDSTRAQQHLRSFLNEHTLRLPKGLTPTPPASVPFGLAFGQSISRLPPPLDSASAGPKRARAWPPSRTGARARSCSCRKCTAACSPPASAAPACAG